MPLRPGDVDAAQRVEHRAARDDRVAVRLVAGPGTGKSATIEERFRWLYDERAAPLDSVYGVSFTRAASKDLRLRVAAYCSAHGVPVTAGEVRITTLHSLALATLARANRLAQYPVRPRVFDEWEVEKVFDAEFAAQSGRTPARCEEIRKSREAFWSLGGLSPANYIQPDPPISAEEQRAFLAFHRPTTQTYAGVLPGEIVRLCVDAMEAGLLPAAELLGMRHLIVDEYQDLNPIDIQFIDRLHDDGVTVFVAGDDDQSVYAFRFASPGGIQDFPTRHQGAGDHVLEGCFRCATTIVRASNRLIENFSPSTRIPKELVSLWESADPPVDGVLYHWRFPMHNVEASAVAESCARLVEAGVAPGQIMILLSNKRIFPPMRRELESRGVPFTPPKSESWRDTDAGRFVLGMLRVIASDDDYLALRLVLGCPRGVGSKTCAQIVERVVDQNLRYSDLFFEAIPPGVFTVRQAHCLERARAVCSGIADMAPEDELGIRFASLRGLLVLARGEEDAEGWDLLMAALPAGMSLAEVRDYMWADTAEQQWTIRAATCRRLELDPPEMPSEGGVRVMSMHGAKGLQADVVFIPGMEDQILPGPRRAGVPGLVLEGARLLYVSMTRARAAVILSFAAKRYWSGSMRDHDPSRYTPHLGGRFTYRAAPLTPDEVAVITGAIEAR